MAWNEWNSSRRAKDGTWLSRCCPATQLIVALIMVKDRHGRIIEGVEGKNTNKRTFHPANISQTIEELTAQSAVTALQKL